MSLFDWPGLMRAGMTRLGLGPDEFWALTPFELKLKLGLGDAADRMTRDALSGLAASFPDH
jgi:uncharacterized phage protein (TIGR02216 family)